MALMIMAIRLFRSHIAMIINVERRGGA